MNRPLHAPVFPPSHHFRGYKGVEIAADAWGDPAAPAVLLMHGGGQTRHAWKGVGQRLAELGYFTVAPDARGHGDSGWAPDVDYSHDAMIEDVRAILHALGKPQAAFVGASMGGVVSIAGIGEGKIPASALVLVDVAPHLQSSGRQRVRDFMGHKPEGFDTIEEVAELIAAYQPQRKRSSSTQGLAKNLRQLPNGKFRWHWDPAYHHFPRDFGELEKRLVAVTPQLRLPLLLVRGQQSDVVTPANVESFRALCPHAEVVEVSGAAHMVAGDENDVFGSAVTDFLLRSVPPRR